MLVHKGTMGVLDEVWAGRYHRGPDGTQAPLYQEAWLADFPALDPSEWWEVDRGSPLGRRIRRYYPLLRPVAGPAGELVDVEILRPDQDRQDAAKAVLRQEALRRGYRQAGRVRPIGLFGAFGVPEHATNRGCPQ